MRILICTGIYPPDIGGAAFYAKELAEEFLRQGHDVKVLMYKFERKLPVGVRHLFYFLKTIFNLPKTNLIIALDTFSVGLPAVAAAKIFKKKIFIRISGDFLWESYVERSENLIILKNFYEKIPILTPKEKIIFFFTKFVLKNCTARIFSTRWQKNIWESVYRFDENTTFVIENFCGQKIADFGFREKKFIWAGRLLRLKNLENLKISFSEIQKENSGIKLEINSRISHGELLQKIQNCYAVILPSLSDVSPNFILDAIRANKPFILTRETGFYEKFKNIGIFIDPLNKEDIKKKILFLADEKNYNEYKRRVAEFNFTHSWWEISEEYINIFESLLK